jgi:hypothetical protein
MLNCGTNSNANTALKNCNTQYVWIAVLRTFVVNMVQKMQQWNSIQFVWFGIK